MKKSQGGFTLIELVVVIVLLGILGVTALGKFQDLSGRAEQASLNGIATEITGSATVNYAGSLLTTAAGDFALDIGDSPSGNGTNVMDTGTAGTACTEAALANLLTGAGTQLPNLGSEDTTVTATAFDTGTTNTASDVCANAGDTFSCQITGGSTSATALVTLICTE